MRDTEDYRNHRISVRAYNPKHGLWKTVTIVDWPSGSDHDVHVFPTKNTERSTRREAKRAAFEMARRWIHRKIEKGE